MGIFLHLIQQSSDTDTQASVTQVDQIEMTGDVQPEQQTDTLQTQAESQLQMSSSNQQNIDEDVIAHGQAEHSQAAELSPGSLPNPDDVISTQLEAEIKDVVSSMPSVGGEAVPQTPDEVDEDKSRVGAPAVEQSNEDNHTNTPDVEAPSDVSVGELEQPNQSIDGTIAPSMADHDSTLIATEGQSHTISINEQRTSDAYVSVISHTGKKSVMLVQVNFA